MHRNTDTKPAIVVDPYSSGVFFAPAFKERGIPSVAYTTAAEPPEVYARAYRADDFEQIIVQSGDLQADAERLRNLNPRCIVAGCESGVELADAITPLVLPDLANDPRFARARRHKGAMAGAVLAARLPIVKQICSADPDEIAEWIEWQNLSGQDLVIKPPMSASTDGVTRVPGGNGWREVFDAMIGTQNRLGITNNQLLIQEYVRGVEYVVDTMSFDGKHAICDICRYRKTDNGPHMAIYDSMEWVAPSGAQYEILASYAHGVLNAVGMRYGTSHIEIMLTADGPRLIELGARPHGGGHPQFCRLATGDSQVDRFVRCVAGDAPIPDSYTLDKNVLVVFLICRHRGIVTNAQILDRAAELRSHHVSNINIRNGDFLEPTRDLFASLDLGFVVLADEDKAQIDADYRAVRRLEAELAQSMDAPRARMVTT